MTRARDNPFATDRVLRVRYRPQGWTWDGLLGRLEAMHYRAALVGPHGSGKTTLLEDIGRMLAARGLRPLHVFVDNSERAIPAGAMPLLRAATRGDVVCFDGADHLSLAQWWRLRWLARRAGGLLITSHGRRMLPILVRTRASLQVAQEIARELGGDSVKLGEVARLFDRHAGNVREVLRSLYDQCAAAE